MFSSNNLPRFLSYLKSFKSLFHSPSIRHSPKLIFALFLCSNFSPFLHKFRAFEPELPEESYKSAIVLTKKDYFMKIVGNNKDFFFFITFREEDPDAFREAQEIASVLQKNIPSSSNILIYLMEKSVYKDIKKTINRVKNLEIYEKDSSINNIDIYFKTPYSGNQAYVKYKPHSFYSQLYQKKLFKYIKKLLNPIEIIEDSELFLKKLQAQTLNKINCPLIVKILPEINEKMIRNYKKTAFFFYERKLLPLQANFIIINNPLIINQFGLQKNETYILRNDFLTKYKETVDPFLEEESVKIEEIHKTALKIEDSVRKNEYFLDKYSVYKEEMLESEKKQINELKDEKRREFNSFSSFVLPRIFLLNDIKTKSLGPFFKKINFNKKKPIISFLLTEDEIENKQRMKNFIRLFHLYHQQFYFIVMNSSALEEFFPHVNRNYARFCVFNFFNQIKNNTQYKNYYKSLMYPYEKYFLNDDVDYFEKFENIQEKTKLFLEHKAKIDLISNINDQIEDVNADILNEKIEKNINFVLELYDYSVKSHFAKGVFNKVSEENTENKLGFLRMNSLNDSPYLVNVARFPAYFLWDSVKKTMYLWQPNMNEINFNKVRLEEELKKFIKNEKGK